MDSPKQIQINLRRSTTVEAHASDRDDHASSAECVMRARMEAAWCAHGENLLRYARRIAGSQEAGRDAVQETFLRLWKQELKNDAIEPKRLAPWLYTVCRRYVLDVRRKECRMTLTGNAVDTAAAGGVKASTPDASEKLLVRERKSAMDTALIHLPKREEEAIRLKFQGGLSYREIAEVMEVSVSHVGVLIHDGMKTLRDRIAREGA
ncbi:MAG: RNA polymerase sigma factor [Phycisphaerae bacterium]